LVAGLAAEVQIQVHLVVEELVVLELAHLFQ
jgi:hypothetical protein